MTYQEYLKANLVALLNEYFDFLSGDKSFDQCKKIIEGTYLVVGGVKGDRMLQLFDDIKILAARTLVNR